MGIEEYKRYRDRLVFEERTTEEPEEDEEETDEEDSEDKSDMSNLSAALGR